MKNQYTTLIRNNANDLIKSSKEVNNFLESQLVSSKIVYKVNLVLEEILTNIIKYAFDDEGEHDIRVLLVLEDTGLMIEFVDDGQEFNPLSVPPPQMKESILESTEGGLGLHLVRQAVESIEYHRDKGRNVLKMTITCS
jgi:anti-sigma regulatory factor (Ser/Thr protein kinase)